MAENIKKEQATTHKLGIYLWIWGLLFVLSFFSYMVDWLQFQGLLRWTLILIFMFLKAGLIMAFFMHLFWERYTLVNVLLWPMTAIATFVGMQAFEWSKLIHEGVRPWENPFGAPQFGSFFFMITGFHGTHVSIGVIFLFIFARKVFRGDFDTGRKGYFTSMKSDYVAIEILGLYWHFVDLVWVFIFAFFYLW